MKDTHTIGSELVLAIHPTSRGFGWIIFEGKTPMDWGIASAKEKRNRKLLQRFRRLLGRYMPDTLVLEAFEDREAHCGERTRNLCRELVHIAKCEGLDAKLYHRSLIQAGFASVGAQTRHEIAESIRLQLDAFSHRMPRKRKPWESADPRQSLFDAAAVALTHFALAPSGKRRV